MDLKMMYIFCLGVFLSALYYAEEVIEEQTYKEKSFLVIGTLLVVKGFISNIIRISNEAELNGIAPKDINWEIK